MEIKIYENLKDASIIERIYCVHNHKVTPQSPIALAVENNKVLGHCAMSGKSNEDLYIEYLKVKEEYRKRGIGTQLLKRVKKWAKDKGFQSLTLSTDSGNFAKYIYYKEGFNLIGGRDITDKEEKELIVMSQALDPETKLISALLDCAREKVDGDKIKNVREAIKQINEGDVDLLLEYVENYSLNNLHNEMSEDEFKRKLSIKYNKYMRKCNHLITDESSLLYECADILDRVINKGEDETMLYMEASGNIKKYGLEGLSEKDVEKCDTILGSYSLIRLDKTCVRQINNESHMEEEIQK